jgi:predicted permease
MSDTAKDVRHAFRRLVRSPAFTVAATLTLALGIAANTAIFTVVESVILSPLPYADSDELLWMDHVAPGIELPGSLGLSQGLYEYYRARGRTFESLAIYRDVEWTLTGEGEPARLAGIVATASLGDALRVPPALGRWFTEEEAQDEAGVVVITHGLWSARFGRDTNILGRTIRLDGTPREVIGVLPASFAFPDASVQLFAPQRINEQQRQTVGGFNFRSVARLREGAAVPDVKRELDELIAGLGDAFPGDPVVPAVATARLAGMPELLVDHEVGGVRRTLWILLGMVGLVLLIACANVANLFLVRSEGIQREVAVRRALGAGQAGIVRYFLAESALLCFAGAAVGLGLAWAGVRLLIRLGPADLPRLNEVAIGPAAIGWTALIAILATVVFGAIPLLRREAALAPTLREGGRGSTVGRARFRARNALMATQVALALVLLVGSGLMVRSFLRLRAVDPGFDARGVLTFDVSLSGNDYEDARGAVGFHEALLERVRALPEVESAGAVSCLPLSGSCWGDPLQVRGRPLQPGDLPPIAQFRRALPGYIETLRIPVLEGRSLQSADHQTRTNSAVISRAFAQAYFPNEDPLGRQIGPMFDATGLASIPDSAWYTIVGIVGDTPVGALAEPDPYPIVYFPVLDRSPVGAGVHAMGFVVRSTRDPLALVSAARAAGAEVNPNVALGNVRSLESTVAGAMSRMAFTMVLLLIAGAVALLLGAVGIYGVISYVVGQRTGEIGVRMALGARPADVSGMVLRQSGIVVGAGLGIGLFAALALARLMTSLLFGVGAADPVTYAVVTAFLLAIAALAAWLPARRAAALDPTAALRGQ